MKTSAAGRALIAQREGRRLAAYRDQKGILTIGVGHTGRMSPPPVTAGMAISDAQCDAMLETDLTPVEAVINSAVRLPISQNEFDAMASLGFNIGAAGLRRSSVVARLNQGDVQGAAEAFLLWDRPAVLRGRRVAERAQFLTPDAAPAGAVSPSRATAAARAGALAARAGRLARTRRTAHATGLATALVGSAGSAVAAHAHHGRLALVVGAVVAAGLAVDVVVSRSRGVAAATLAGHAARETASADRLAADTSSAPAPAPVIP